MIRAEGADPPPHTVSLTVKYLFFFTPYLTTYKTQMTPMALMTLMTKTPADPAEPPCLCLL